MSFADSPFSSAPFAATGETNAVVELSGLQLNIAENNLTVSAGGSVVTGSEENTIETFLGTLIAESESIVDVTGVSATLSLPNITDGLTVDFDRTAFTSFTLGTALTEDITWQTDSSGILLKSSYTEGEIWWEVGGTGQGAYLGIAKINDQYFIRFRSGSGSTSHQEQSDSSEFAVVNLAITDSSVSNFFDDQRHIVTFSIDVTNNKLLVWIDNILVIDYDATANDGNVIQNGQWAGTNPGGYGQSFGNAVAGGSSTYDGGATQYQYEVASSTIESGSVLFQINEQIPNAEEYPVEVNGSADVDVTGIELSTELGTETIVANSNVDVTGEVLSTELGTEVVTASALVQPTGIEVSFAEGDAIVTANSNIEVTGLSSEFATGTVVAPAAVILTGVSMQFAEGTETIVADANVDVTGLEINFTEGIATVEANATVVLTGLEINFTEGTATVVADAIIDVTGLEISSQSGNVVVTADADVQVTGQVLSFALGKETITGAWGPVDPDANNSYNNVAPGASNSWTEVAA